MLDFIEKTAREASKIILKYYGNLEQIEFKQNPKDLVTIADREVEEFLISSLLKETPGYKVLAEESGTSLGNKDFTWIIDPIDGTKNYAHSLPIFSISIALAEGSEIIYGVIYDIMRDELFKAERGKGAFCNGKKISVSKTDKVVNSLLATGFPYTIEQNPDFCLERFISMVKVAGGIRRLGSAAIDCAYTAAGRVDGFWEVFLHPWDIAAGMLIIEEAGGKVTDFSGSKRSSVFDKQFLASNGLIHNEMAHLLTSAQNIRIEQC